MPDWRLSFCLPDGYSLAQGFASGIIGLTIGRHRWVEVAGKRRDWVIGQAIIFMRQVAPRERTLLARLVRSNEPGPTLSGPLRRGDDKVIEIPLRGTRPTVVEGTVMRQLDFAL